MLVQHELLLFACVVFLVGALDELAVDLVWVWLKLSRRAQVPQLPTDGPPELSGIAAIFIPAWREERVIGTTITHALRAWPHRGLRLYVGCYRNDPPTMDAIIAASHGDARVRLVVLGKDGPTTKADCLNQLYQALETDEMRLDFRARMVVLHDAEDMVDPAALSLIDRAMDHAELVQLPVLPVPQPDSRWISGHYCEEFAEAHGKAMVVREALGAGMPLAGVGCAVEREMLARLAASKPGGDPFAADCLTEDYELGLGLSDLGARTGFVRRRYGEGRLVATRACFPAQLEGAVRQKTRWVHGIAFQGWDRIGWGDRPAEIWMRLRDRRGPLAALVLAIAYCLLLLSPIGWAAGLYGGGEAASLSPTLTALLSLNLAAFLWRALFRFGFTAREYGWREGARAVLRIPLANLIAIMAGRRALGAYLATLWGRKIRWDKTEHSAHPVTLQAHELAA